MVDSASTINSFVTLHVLWYLFLVGFIYIRMYIHIKCRFTNAKITCKKASSEVISIYTMFRNMYLLLGNNKCINVHINCSIYVIQKQEMIRNTTELKAPEKTGERSRRLIISIGSTANEVRIGLK